MAIRKLFEKVAKAIKWEHIDDLAVRENNLGAKSVTEPKHADLGVSTRALANQSVTEPKLADSSVPTRALQNESVTIDKLATDAKGKASVGLGNVDNTSDANKPLSTAMVAALAGKQATLPTGTVDDYLRGDQSFQRLSSTSVFLQPDNATGNINSITAPGVYQYYTVTANLPTGAGASGTLYVYHGGIDIKTQLLIDFTGQAWVRALSVSTWSDWNRMTSGGSAHFFGTNANQVHTANSEERANYTTQSAQNITNASGLLTISRAGKYRVVATATSHWKPEAAGAGRTLRIHKNGTSVAETMTDVPVVWGNGLGAFSLTTQAYLTIAAGDTVEGKLYHGTNKTLTCKHYIEVTTLE